MVSFYLHTKYAKDTLGKRTHKPEKTQLLTLRNWLISQKKKNKNKKDNPETWVLFPLHDFMHAQK